MKLQALFKLYLHYEMGHLGVERVLHLAKSSFYWTGIQKQVELFITQMCQFNN